jgi:large subunit ribosomal protein L32e
LEQVSNPTKKSLKLRRRIKKNKPKFLRPESWRYVRLKESWRRPRGLDHKMRKSIKGWPPNVGVGYRGPRVARGLHPSGYREVIVHNIEELDGIDPKLQAIRLAHTVGMRKRARILAEARKKRILVLNAKEIKELIKKETPPSEEKEKHEPAAEAKEQEESRETESSEEAKPKRRRRTRKQ